MAPLADVVIQSSAATILKQRFWALQRPPPQAEHGHLGAGPEAKKRCCGPRMKAARWRVPREDMVAAAGLEEQGAGGRALRP
ncbi:hypothetical protein NDU88_005964 [Pleurodeles waltl]|uniref:Uncharacterized protein n=1 Tax=Pleurodeles waltl TaxID=8319 RepID=A0AAV7QMT6_PLEWA|nr:hypothetical protein NDU88_005964 [Pleurodeles waltl]